MKADGRRKALKQGRDELGNPFKTEKQAAEARQQAMALEKMHLLQPPRKKPGRKKMKAVYKEYCEKGRMDKAFPTKKKQDSLWNNHVRKRFGNRYIDEISVAEINDYLAELYCVRHFSYGYVEGFLKLFYLIFGQAYSRNYMSQDDYNRLCVHKNGRIRMPSRKSAAAENRKHQTEWAIKHHAKPLREKHRIAFRLHNLRHTYGINLALQNIPAHILSNQMGHSKSSTTHKYYLAMSTEGIRALKDNLNRL